jgi:hypothetical protein
MIERTILQDIILGTPSSLRSARLKMEGEVGCNQLKQHPLYEMLLDKELGYSITHQLKKFKKPPQR